MATTGAPLPDPMGGTSSTYLSLVVDIIPVRIINTNPLLVQVVNFPGVPPPLPGAFGSLKAMPPALPGQKAAPATPKSGFASLGLGDFGLGSLAKLGTVAGAAAMGVSLVTGAFSELKSTFIDPVIGAAKGGFDKGVSRGMGTGGVESAAETLGVVFGVILLPVVIKFAATMLAAARAADEWTPLIKASMPALALVANPGGGATGSIKLAEASLGPLGMLLGPKTKGRIVDSMFGVSAPAIRKTAEGEPQAEKDILKLLMMQQGAQGAFVGVGDIRGQAQLAAMQDPLEAERRRIMMEQLQKLGMIADNTTPPPAAGGTK